MSAEIKHSGAIKPAVTLSLSDASQTGNTATFPAPSQTGASSKNHLKDTSVQTRLELILANSSASKAALKLTPDLENFFCNFTDEEWSKLQAQVQGLTKANYSSFLARLDSESELKTLIQDSELPPLAMRALIEGKITVSQASNLLIQHSAYQSQLGKQVQLQLIPTELAAFKQVLPPLLGKIELTELELKELMQSIETLSPAERLMSSIQIPEDNSQTGQFSRALAKIRLRTFIYNGETTSIQIGLFSPKVAQLIFQAAYGTHAVEPYPTTGSKLSAPEDFERIDKRILWVPLPGIVESPAEVHCFRVQALEVLLHDYYHCHVESANRTKDFLLEAALHFKSVIGDDPQKKLIYNSVLDREIDYLFFVEKGDPSNFHRLLFLYRAIYSKLMIRSPDLLQAIPTAVKALGLNAADYQRTSGRPRSQINESHLKTLYDSFDKLAQELILDFMEELKGPKYQQFGFSDQDLTIFKSILPTLRASWDQEAL